MKTIKKKPTELKLPIEKSINFSIEKTFSRGKKVVLAVYPNGKVELRFPKRTSESFLNQFISEKLDWITNKLKEQSKKVQPKQIEFTEGESIIIFGEQYSLSFEKKESNQLLNQNSIKLFKISLGRSKDKKKVTKKILSDILKEKIEAILIQYTQKLGVKVNRIQIKSMKSLWGSCSSQNNLSFNLALVHCPENIIRYLVVHEVCHTVERNHSKKFWTLVKNLYPNYKSAEVWLKKEGKCFIHYLS